MTVHVHVERLVLEGLEVGDAGAHALADALRAQLTRSLAERPPASPSGTAVHSAPAPAVALRDGAPAAIGGGVALSVEAAIRTAAGQAS